jgi:hypothetical protein
MEMIKPQRDQAQLCMSWIICVTKSRIIYNSYLIGWDIIFCNHYRIYRNGTEMFFINPKCIIVTEITKVLMYIFKFVFDTETSQIVFCVTSR